MSQSWRPWRKWALLYWRWRLRGQYKMRAQYYADEGFTLWTAHTPTGEYIGNESYAQHLLKRGIRPELASPSKQVCSIGFCEREQKWYGWSHRAMYGFKIGDTVDEGDCCAMSGWTDDYLRDHPEADVSLPVGFTARTLDDAKRMAIAFAEAVG